MVLKLGEIWQETAGNGMPLRYPSRAVLDDLAETDPSLPGPAHERKLRRKREEEFLHEQQESQHRVTEENRDSETDALLIEAWLASEEYRRAIEDLSHEIADARRAALRAYEHALRKEEEAREALEEARRNAIVLADGRRVYFTRDGAHLYAEDAARITDRAPIEEARQHRAARPGATTWEEFTERLNERDHAARVSGEIQKAIAELDDLDERIRRGGLSRKEIAQARGELRAAIDSLPPDARKEYQLRQAARNGNRKLTHTDVGPAFEKAPDLNGEFRQAQNLADKSINSPDQSSPGAASRRPLTVTAPDF